MNKLSLLSLLGVILFLSTFCSKKQSKLSEQRNVGVGLTKSNKEVHFKDFDFFTMTGEHPIGEQDEPYPYILVKNESEKDTVKLLIYYNLEQKKKNDFFEMTFVKEKDYYKYVHRYIENSSFEHKDYYFVHQGYILHFSYTKEKYGSDETKEFKFSHVQKLTKNKKVTVSSPILDRLRDLKPDPYFDIEKYIYDDYDVKVESYTILEDGLEKKIVNQEEKGERTTYTEMFLFEDSIGRRDVFSYFFHIFSYL